MWMVTTRGVRVGGVLVAACAMLALSGPGLARAADEASPTPAKKAAPKKKAAPAKKAAAKKEAPVATSPVGALKQMVEGEDVLDFRSFCDSWMQKLRERETYNTAHIAWDRKDGSVVGEYVGYGSDRTCVARQEPGKDPIGKITYRETKYRRQGSTPEVAMTGTGTIVEQTDVTEIFRYAKGRWQY